MWKRFIYIIACISISFLLLPNNIPLYGCTICYLSTHQVIDIWIVSAFWLLWIPLLWAFMYKFLCGYVFSFFRYVPRSVTAGFYDNSMFSILRNCQTIFQSGCAIIHSLAIYKNITFSILLPSLVIVYLLHYNHPCGF